MEGSMEVECLPDDDRRLVDLARSLGEAAQSARMTLATAESCTGGGIAASITAIAGSSEWFDRAFVTYSNAAKREMLGVGETTLRRHGAVSVEVALEMLAGALARSEADAAIAVTGVAGPAGGSTDKPVGTVCFAWGRRGEPADSRRCRFDGDRASVRRESIAWALAQLRALCAASARRP
jgi:nicotinamide-nucleotide amidase